jgi:hypothetical protein
MDTNYLHFEQPNAIHSRIVRNKLSRRRRRK